MKDDIANLSPLEEQYRNLALSPKEIKMRDIP